MRIGLDLDGCFADFNRGFIQRILTVTGRDLFGPSYIPDCWAYPEKVGYTAEEVSRVWDNVTADAHFWEGLVPYVGAIDALTRWSSLSYRDDIYFITSRPGKEAKQQTERWLRAYGFTRTPTVLVTSQKGPACGILKLDAYLDDHYPNALDAAAYRGEKRTHSYLLDRPWNQDRVRIPSHFYVVSALDEFYDAVVPGRATIGCGAL